MQILSENRAPVCLVWCVALAALIATGCASTPADQFDPSEVLSGEFDGAPSWVIDGCSTHWDEDTPKVCGVGSVSGTRNISLMRTTAVGRARTELARSLDTRVKAMLKDYASTTTGGSEFGRAANDEQHIVDVSKQITDISLTGVEHVSNWVSKNGTYYALVALDAEKFADTVARMDQLSDAVRQAVVKRAEKAFAELDDEIEAERNR